MSTTTRPRLSSLINPCLYMFIILSLCALSASLLKDVLFVFLKLSIHISPWKNGSVMSPSQTSLDMVYDHKTGVIIKSVIVAS